MYCIVGFDANMSVALWKSIHFERLLLSESSELTESSNRLKSFDDCSNPSESVSSKPYSSSRLNDDEPVLRKFYHCIIGKGDILYFPDRWMHATLNNDQYNFFVSLFVDKQLLVSRALNPTAFTSK